MARITDQEFDLIQSAVHEWKYRFEKTMGSFYDDYGIDESKWDSSTVDLHKDYLKEAQDIMKAEATVWGTLYDLRNEVDE